MNAILHRDYRLNRDIFVRIFDDRIEGGKPSVFPATLPRHHWPRRKPRRNPCSRKTCASFRCRRTLMRVRA